MDKLHQDTVPRSMYKRFDEMSEKEILLDGEAQSLFEQLGGLDTQERGRDPHSTEGFVESMIEEEKRVDDWRIILVEFAFLFAGCLNSVRLSGLTSKHEEDIDSMLAVLKKLSEMPSQDGKILIRFRGTALPPDRKSSKESDYVLSFGDLNVDIPIIKAVVNRRGIAASHLPGRLTGAFNILDSMEINTLRIAIGTGDPEDKRLMIESLHLLLRYFMATRRGSSISSRGDGGEGLPSVVYNENSQPDLNLTLLAYLNGLSPDAIQGLVKKVSGMMDRPGLEHITSAYSAILTFKNLQKRLVRPPLEINNIRWLIAGQDQEVFSKEKAQVSRTVMAKFGNSPQKAADVIQGVYGKDFSIIGANTLEARLSRITDFLDTIEKNDGYQSVENEVLQNVERRLDEVPDEVLDDLVVEENDIRAQIRQREILKNKLNEKLFEIVSFFKRRSITKKKIREIMHHAIDFDDKDYETIARDFKIPVEDAKDLLELLKGCFDKTGRFLRGAFEKNILKFALHEKKVFGFLWHYLKEIKDRKDRVAFLNSLQSLVAKMQQTQFALGILLEDLCRDPHKIIFSDRNILIVANVLLRKYNKELRNDIELTPEEVLLVRDGLNSDTVDFASKFIVREQEKIFQKITSIHQNLKEALEPGTVDTAPMPAGYLITLEREFYIFLSLLGWATEHKVIQGAVKEYGYPDSDVYRLKASPDYFGQLFRLLQVTVRGLARFEDRDDLPLLHDIRKREIDFLILKKKSLQKNLVRRVMGWVDASIDTISKG